MPNPHDDLRAVSDGVRINEFLPTLQAESEKQQAHIEARVYKAIAEGSLTPEAALYAWMEKKSLRDMIKNLETKARVGVSAGQRVKPLLDGSRTGDSLEGLPSTTS